MKNKYGLSRREYEVVALLLEGKSNKQIATILDISISTVEFHLTNIYAKLGISSRTEAILLLSQPRKTPNDGASDETGEKARFSKDNLGESPVEKTELSPDNGRERILLIQESSDLSAKTRSFFGAYKTRIAISTMLVLATIVAIVLYLSVPKSWNRYERECEHPDEFIGGQMIGRSNASGSTVFGQFGTTSDAPWPALPSSVTYKNINTPYVEQLYMKMRYSKNSPSSVPILVFIDDEKNPRAAFYPTDQGDWNHFAWTEPIFLGSVDSGVHTLRFSTNGQQYGVADLDKFILSAGVP
jgi:DNA-binding CsgD family transcriptional regulator